MAEKHLTILLVHLLVISVPASGAATSCNTMTSCDLFSEIQKHSKLIAGFSYNVKKADSALTQLRSEKIGLTNRVAALENELKEGENDTVFLTNQEALNKLTLQDKELETAIGSLSANLDELKEEVGVIFLDNIRSNDEDVVDLHTKLSQLNEQVERLNDIVRNHTDSSENPEISVTDNRQVSAMKKKYSRLQSKLNEMTKSCAAEEVGENLDTLGIELETVKSSYDTLQDQVSELEQSCINQNGRLEKMLEELTKKVDELEKQKEEGVDNIQNSIVLSEINQQDPNVTVVRISTKP